MWASAQAATRRTPEVAVGEHLAKSNLERAKGAGPFRVVPVDQPGDRGIGLLGAGVFEHREHPLDRAVHRPAHDAAAGDRHRRSGPWEAPGRPSSVPAPSRLIVIF